MSLRDLVSREVVELPEGVEKVLVFSGVQIRELATGREVTLREEVNLDLYGPVTMRFTSPATGLETSRPGIRFLVVEEDGEEVPEKPLNVISVRLLERLKPDLESGAYLRYRYRITAVGAAPKTQYQVVRE